MNKAILQYLKRRNIRKRPTYLYHGTRKELMMGRDPLKMSAFRNFSNKSDLSVGLYTIANRRVAADYAIWDGTSTGNIYRFSPRKDSVILPYDVKYIGSRNGREHQFNNLGTFIRNEMHKDGLLNSVSPEEYLRNIGIQGWRKRDAIYPNTFIFNDLRALDLKSITEYPSLKVKRKRKW